MHINVSKMTTKEVIMLASLVTAREPYNENSIIDIESGRLSYGEINFRIALWCKNMIDTSNQMIVSKMIGEIAIKSLKNLIAQSSLPMSKYVDFTNNNQFMMTVGPEPKIITTINNTTEYKNKSISPPTGSNSIPIQLLNTTKMNFSNISLTDMINHKISFSEFIFNIVEQLRHDFYNELVHDLECIEVKGGFTKTIKTNGIYIKASYDTLITKVICDCKSKVEARAISSSNLINSIKQSKQKIDISSTIIIPSKYYTNKQNIHINIEDRIFILPYKSDTKYLKVYIQDTMPVSINSGIVSGSQNFGITMISDTSIAGIYK